MPNRAFRLIFLALALTPLATASLYSFSFSGGAESGSGMLNTTPNGDGSETVTSISGSLSRTYSLSNLYPPGTTDPAITFTTDNLIYPASSSLLSATGGLEFKAGVFNNVILFADGPGDYVQYDANDGVSYHLGNLQFTYLGADATVTNASDFSFSYSAAGALTAAGTLWASSNNDGSWTVLGLNGSETLTVPITGLLAPGAFLDNDNLIFPGGPTVVDTNGGLGFSTFETQEILFTGGNFAPSYDNVSGPLLLDYRVDQFDLVPAPEPGSALLVAAGVLGLLTYIAAVVRKRLCLHPNPVHQ